LTKIYSPELLFAGADSLALEDEPESDEAVETTGAESLLAPLVSPSVLTGAGLTALDFDLWSVAYQPEPLKTIPAGVMTLRSLFLLHSGQRVSGSSLND
jgi:hypothetical protein